MNEPVIVAAVRTPIGRAFKGSLVDCRPDDLGALVIRAALDQVPNLDPAEIEDVLLGCAQPAGEQGYNLARVSAILAGLTATPGATINRYCASSLQGIRTAAHAIQVGEGDVFVAAGVECVSRFSRGKSDGMPDTHNERFGAAEARSAQRALGDGGVWTPIDGLPDVYIGMGQTAENVAEIEQVTRDAQDEFALRSQQRAAAAAAAGAFDREIVPVELADGTRVSRDDGIRPDTTLERLAALKPVFRPEGSVTAGNACPLNDGAAAVIVMSAARAAALGVRPRARIVSSAVSGLDPEIMGLGPIEASRRALQRAGLKIDDIDLVEINEAFAAQVIPSAAQLGIDPDRLNVRGGAIALGHPFGQTGARIMTTLLHALEDTGGRYGLETMCAGGGQGMAMIIERL